MVDRWHIGSRLLGGMMRGGTGDMVGSSRQGRGEEGGATEGEAVVRK